MKVKAIEKKMKFTKDENDPSRCLSLRDVARTVFEPEPEEGDSSRSHSFRDGTGYHQLHGIRTNRSVSVMRSKGSLIEEPLLFECLGNKVPSVLGFSQPATGPRRRSRWTSPWRGR